MRLRPALWTALLLWCAAAGAQSGYATDGGWPTYGGDAGGQRYSGAAQITRANIKSLRPAWTYHTHALESGFPSVSRSDFEATPILFQEVLYLSTPFDRVIALDPATGAEKWAYDPGLPKDIIAANYTSRGVAAWKSTQEGTAPCSARIFVATLDARLIALDAGNGRPCTDFGRDGQLDLRRNIKTSQQHPYRFYGNTSPATVVGDVVVVGSAVGDNQAVSVEPGVVRGFDVRTGKLLWAWDPLPWAAAQSPRTGAGNAWSVLAADPAHHLVYVPTGSPAPDFWGGYRPGDDKDANSLVALDARTGKKVWAFQLVHHDVWDYDTASEPLLFDFRGKTPAVAIAPKTGVLFVLNRLTGEPLFPVTERPVPQNGAPGDTLSPTQPFSSLPPLTAIHLDLKTLIASHHGDACAQRLSRLRYEGIFTPPGVERGTLEFPGSLGGVNWGSMSLDPATNVLYANTNRSAYEIRLVAQPTKLSHLLHRRMLWFGLAAAALLVGALRRRSFWPGAIMCTVAVGLLVCSLFAKPPSRFTYSRGHNMVNSPDAVGEVSPNEGAPFQIYRRVLQDDEGRPCTFQPWGTTEALDLNSGRMVWEKPLGTLIAGEHTGTVNFGAPIVTGGDLLFTAASSQPLLRALDKRTGEEVWTGALPVPAQSTPMTYTFHGRQFVVVSAGGHGGLGTPLGDSVVAFALR